MSTAATDCLGSLISLLRKVKQNNAVGAVFSVESVSCFCAVIYVFCLQGCGEAQPAG